jgi:hypothetical protein
MESSQHLSLPPMEASPASVTSSDESFFGQNHFAFRPHVFLSILFWNTSSALFP